MAYEPLPIVDAPVGDLRLDLDNYRIPTRPDDEAGALNYLFASEDVLGAARMILRDGYFDNEVPIVTSDGVAGYVVLEGNRRVGALKTLLDPRLIPTHQREIESLLKRYAIEAERLPTVVRVLVAPDRKTAEPHIARLHTGLSKRRWSRDQQATFYFSLLADDRSVQDIKDEYPSVEVTRFIRMAVTRRFLSGVRFEDPSLHEYATSDALRMSAFEYAYRNKTIAEAIGLSYDRDGLLLPTSRTPERIGAELEGDKRDALEFLVGEFRAERLSTRSSEFKKKTEEHQALLRQLQRAGESDQSSPPAPGGPVQGSTPRDAGARGGEEAGTKASAADRSGPPTRRGPNHPDTKVRLDLTGIDESATPVNLKVRYQELRRIAVTDFPVSTAILMRSALEMTIKWHFDALGTPLNGELRTIMKDVRKAYGKELALKGTINAIDSGTGHQAGSISWLNAAAHDANSVVKANDVRQAWEKINPLVRFLLRSPSEQQR